MHPRLLSLSLLEKEELNRETEKFVEELEKLREELDQKEKRRTALYEELVVLQKRNDELKKSKIYDRGLVRASILTPLKTLPKA